MYYLNNKNIITTIMNINLNNKIYMITYGNFKYENAKNRIAREATESNLFDSIEVLGPDNLTDNFKKKFKKILKMERGGGYWIWKYDIILSKLNKMNDGDFLVYVDAGCTINKNGKKRFEEYINLLKESKKGIISFQLVFPELCWTTKEIFSYFNIPYNSHIAQSGQYVGGILIMQNIPITIKIFNICLETLLKDPYLITDEYNDNQEYFFRDNRHDQSISSIVRKLIGSYVIPDETYQINGEYDYNCPFLATRKN